VIKNNLETIKKNIPQIVEGPFYKGVDALGESSVDLLFMANCKEEDIYIVQRAMNRELKLLFDENNINIPFPQVVVNEPVQFEDANLSKKQERTAAKFVAEQQELSKEMEEISE
jgi:small conductance mechanosensitive channel